MPTLVDVTFASTFASTFGPAFAGAFAARTFDGFADEASLEGLGVASERFFSFFSCFSGASGGFEGGSLRGMILGRWGE